MVSIFGAWLIGYSFPLGVVIELIFCYFPRGNLGVKVNNLQQKLQRQREEQLGPQEIKNIVRNLSKKSSLYWLHIQLIEKLGRKSFESNKRIAQTIEALEKQRSSILFELEPLKPPIYRTLNNLQEWGRSLIQTDTEKEYVKIEKIINQIVSYIANSSFVEIQSEEVLKIIYQKIEENYQEVRPSKLRTIYKIEDIIKAFLFSYSKLSKNDESKKEENLENNNILVNSKQNIEELESKLAIREQQIKMLRQFNDTKALGKLKGKYIGNIKDKTSKYHHSEKCKNWKKLMFDWWINKYEQHEIIVKTNPNYFIKLGMEECKDCQKYKYNEIRGQNKRE